MQNISKDYIVEQGTEVVTDTNGDRDTWFYRKWVSGIAECWTDTPSKSINNDSLNYPQIPLPFTFYQIPTIFSSVFCGNGLNYSVVPQPTIQVYASTTTAYSMAINATGVTKAYGLTIYVKGLWKAFNS